jgi:hypothetical protein
VALSLYLPNLFDEDKTPTGVSREGWVMAGSATLSLDSIINSALFFAAKWEPTLKRSQSRDVLRTIINKLYGANRGAIFHSNVRCSHAALAEALDLSREWTCKLVGRLRDTGWIQTHARRLPDGTQEITIFSPGRMMKRLLVMLLKSRQRRPSSRVNSSSQLLPTKEEVEKNKSFLADLRDTLTQKFAFQDPKGRLFNR